MKTRWTKPVIGERPREHGGDGLPHRQARRDRLAEGRRARQVTRDAGGAMQIRVLGAAAGGGFPQWNDATGPSRRARSGDPTARLATQASVAVSADGERWVLLNASPDIRAQIEATDALHPRGAPRSSPIAAVVLTNGDVDAVAGLLSLREGTPFALLAHEWVLSVLDANPIFEVVRHGVVPRRALPLDRWEAVRDADGAPLGIELRAFAVPGKVPLYLEGGASEEDILGATAGETIGLELCAGGARMVYAANTAAVTDGLRERLRGADLAFVDGTLWRDDEMIRAGVGAKTGRRMAHVSMSGPDGAMTRLEGLGIGRAVFIHVNNTNPALLADSPERAELERRGFEVAHDGMALTLKLTLEPARAEASP